LRGRFDNVDFCIALDAYCNRYGVDPWLYFVDEQRLPWMVRHGVWMQAAQWRHEQEQKQREEIEEEHRYDTPPRPRTLEELQEATVRQSKAFEEMLAIVEGRAGDR